MAETLPFTDVGRPCCSSPDFFKCRKYVFKAISKNEIIAEISGYSVDLCGPQSEKTFIACEQQRCRPACAFAQSDQHLFYSHTGHTGLGNTAFQFSS